MSTRPSQYDDGKGNWHSDHRTFDEWIRADRPSRFVADLRTEEEKRQALYQNRGLFEPEFT